MNRKQTFTRNTTLLLFMIWLLLVLASVYIFNYVDSTQGLNDFLEQLAKLLLQAAIIVFIGAVLNFILNRLYKQKEKEEADRQNRIEFLRRVRAVHTTIQTSQTLLIAHKSPKTYVEVMRKLIQLVYDVIEIEEDLKVTVDLFSEKTKMVSALENISSYIKEGVEEYKKFKKYVESKYDKNVDDNLSPAINERDIKWLNDFWNGDGDYKSIYGINITVIKSELRKAVYQN